MIRYVYLSSCEVPLFLSDYSESCIFFDIFLKNTQIPNLMEIRPVGAELFHADRQRDMTKLMVAFRNFANSPKICMSAEFQYWKNFE